MGFNNKIKCKDVEKLVVLWMWRRGCAEQLTRRKLARSNFPFSFRVTAHSKLGTSTKLIKQVGYREQVSNWETGQKSVRMRVVSYILGKLTFPPMHTSESWFKCKNVNLDFILFSFYQNHSFSDRLAQKNSCFHFWNHIFLFNSLHSHVIILTKYGIISLSHHIHINLISRSGIISLIGCGLIQAHYAFKNISGESLTTVSCCCCWWWWWWWWWWW